ncbi:hypothetical protein AKO1_015086, partial [Acrasis kona]
LISFFLRLQKFNSLTKQLETSIGYTFNDKSLIQLAMTHKSFNPFYMCKHGINNERLEFLGDAVLDMIVTHKLHHTFKNSSERLLYRYKVSTVRNTNLAESAERLNLCDYLIQNISEKNYQPTEKEHADTLEAMIGAIFLDSGWDQAEKFVEDFVIKDYDEDTDQQEHHTYEMALLPEFTRNTSPIESTVKAAKRFED